MDMEVTTPAKPMRLTPAETRAKRAKLREATLNALKRASKLCKHHHILEMNIEESSHYASFQEHVNTALGRLLTNTKAYRVGFQMFLPNRTMRRAADDFGFVNVSDFVATPLDEFRSFIKACEMEVPRYVDYLHPDYKDDASQ